MTVSLTEFVISNGVLSNGVFTGTVQYGISTNQLISTVKIAVNWNDGVTVSGTNYGVSATTGSFGISKTLSPGAKSIQIQAQAVSIAPDGTINPQGSIIQGGTFFPLVMAPSITVQSYTFDGVNLNITFSILNGGTYPKNVTLNTWAGTSTKSVTNPTNINPVSVQFQVSIPGSPNPTPLELYDSATFDVFFNQPINSGTQGQNVGPIDILLQNGNKITNVILTAPDYLSLQNNTAPFVVLYAGTGNSVTSTPHTTTNANYTYSQIATMITNGTVAIPTNLLPALQAAIQYQLSRADLTAAFPGTFTGNYAALINWASLYSSGTPIAQYLSAYQYMENNPSSIPSVTPPPQPVQCVALTVKAVDGTQQTFYLSAADASAVSVSPPGAIISSVNSTNPITNTLTDVANFFQAHNQSTTPPPQPTPPPIVSTPQVSGNNVTITYSSTGTAILITRNGTPVSTTATLTTGTLVDQGLNPGTYQYTFVASKVGVQSTPVSVTATVLTPPPAQTNFAYNIQIPNVNNALQLITATNYGTGSQISFPARAFVKNILNQDVATIPNTLNALFISNVGTTPNEVQVANALIGYFPAVPVQTGPKRSIIEYAGGIFAGLLTLSLFTSGNTKKGKR